MKPLELSEIQSFLTQEYKEMHCSRYYLLQITNAEEARKFLSGIANEISVISSAVNETCLNLGLTQTGLRNLGLAEENLATFSREFREGMVTEHRQRLLGDIDGSDPSRWQWGGPANERTDVVLLVFGKSESVTDQYFDQLRNRFSNGLKLVHVLNGTPLPGDKEHFGFRDGISQPAIIGTGVKGIGNDNIRAGEFIMGYKNEYDIYPDTPLLVKEQGDPTLLTHDAEFKATPDLGRNGTYFVLRQLQQDVNGFWNFLNEKTKNPDGSLNNDASLHVAAKMMGRWPSGAPLVKYPDKDPGGTIDDNDFNYAKEDSQGLKCPFGAHIRRTNPRDNFEESPRGISKNLTRRHRILRRVRSYGEPFIGSPENHNPQGEVGLYFGCYNADISRQFEFIQYTWANYPKFKRLYADPDPFIGVKENPLPGEEQNFTIPQQTVNKVITDLKRFVHVKGGSYFFIPSVSTIRFLGTL